MKKVVAFTSCLMVYSIAFGQSQLRFQNFDTRDGQIIEELEMDHSGKVWMITSSGIVKYNPADSTTTVFNDKNGWPSSFTSLKALNDGRVAAGTIGEILIIDPAEIQPETYNPRPYITQVGIDEKESYFMPGQDTAFRLKHNQSIRFNYISLTYHNAASNKYAWQLKGLDDQWHKTGNANSQPFASLSPGRYTFSVKSANANNIWSDDVSSVRFVVMPPFYRAWWFLMSAFFIFAGTVYWIYNYRMQKALQMEKMRTRIATDLHDDIGATLSSISFYSEAVNIRAKEKFPEVSSILEKMGETSRAMVGSMSDIVWAINPANDDMGKMVDRMQSHAKELCAIREKKLVLSVDEKVRTLRPQLEQRRNIYLIFKEALNNALKYAECSEIRLDIHLHGNLFHLRLADDGIGFNAEIDSDGNGIKSMQRRAQEISAEIKIISKPGLGTTIDLMVPE